MDETRYMVEFYEPQTKEWRVDVVDQVVFVSLPEAKRRAEWCSKRSGWRSRIVQLTVSPLAIAGPPKEK